MYVIVLIFRVALLVAGSAIARGNFTDVVSGSPVFRWTFYTLLALISVSTLGDQGTQEFINFQF